MWLATSILLIGSMGMPCTPNQVGCCALLDEHPTMVPGQTWGTFGPDDKTYWTANNCDEVVGWQTKPNCPCREVKRGKVKYMSNLAVIILCCIKLLIS